jgi:hypothetical protein
MQHKTGLDAESMREVVDDPDADDESDADAVVSKDSNTRDTAALQAPSIHRRFLVPKSAVRGSGKRSVSESMSNSTESSPAPSGKKSKLNTSSLFREMTSSVNILTSEIKKGNENDARLLRGRLQSPVSTSARLLV